MKKTFRSQSTPLSFAELAPGDKFIAFPVDGDDSGHGGYRSGAWVFSKLRLSRGKNGENAVRLADGVLTDFSDNASVYKVFV